MRSRPLHLRVLALGALAALSSSTAAALIDSATFRHVTCPEHGELLHADDSAGHAETTRAPGISPGASDFAHAHAHCPITVLSRGEAVVGSSATVTAAVDFALVALVGRALSSHPSVSPIDLAPKCSPPASAA